ncbi:MAG: two-component system response regulator [Bacteroidetes bacterium GWA2_31_9b]|nr:MAG: two-component system response regulator [Bacteroidetes bacterium GWA2_31_9b]
MKNILLVEDDIDLGNVLKQYLVLNNFEVTLCRDGLIGLNAFKENKFDLCIFDIMMPEMDGFTLAENILINNNSIPFIFLTARIMIEDRIKGLKLGADDYICKPFEPEELILRINNILKRKIINTNDSICIGEYKFDISNFLLIYKENKIQLTEKEALVLQYFIKNSNKVIKRSDILNEIWGGNDYFSGRSMDVFISRLRKYLINDKSINIKSIRGIGFCFNVQ